MGNSASEGKLLVHLSAHLMLSGEVCAGVRQIEKLGLLTKAEKFGLLSTLERLLTSDPAAISSLAIPAFVVSLGASPTAHPCGRRLAHWAAAALVYWALCAFVQRLCSICCDGLHFTIAVICAPVC